MLCALMYISNNGKFKSKKYEIYRREYSLYMSIKMKGFKHSESSKNKIALASSTYRHTDETKKKLSLIAKNRSSEHRKKISDSNKGKRVSEETRNKMSQSHKGFVHSAHSKQKIKEQRKKQIFTEETKRKIGLKKQRSIERIDCITNEIKLYTSIKSVELDGFSKSMVQKVCSGKFEKYKNFYWIYKLNEKENK